MNNLDGTQTPSTGAATAGLRIGQWHLRRHKSPALTPINVYADRTLACPACGTELAFQGDRWSCTQCAGTFMQNDALEGLVLDITGDAWRVPTPTGSPGERACPVCSEKMIAEDLERVPIDRCAAHGLWFDARELAILLERASGQFDKHGIRAWLAHFF
jgi:Zn-finger nucleic acid-binding protein